MPAAFFFKASLDALGYPDIGALRPGLSGDGDLFAYKSSAEGLEGFACIRKIDLVSGQDYVFSCVPKDQATSDLFSAQLGANYFDQAATLADGTLEPKISGKGLGKARRKDTQAEVGFIPSATLYGHVALDDASGDPDNRSDYELVP